MQCACGHDHNDHAGEVHDDEPCMVCSCRYYSPESLDHGC